MSDQYVVLRRQHLRIEESVSLITACGVLFTQILLCAAAWIVIICWKMFPVYICVFGFVGFTIILFLMLFFLKTQSACRNLSENLLTKHLDGFHVYGIRGGGTGFIKRVWKSQLPLRIYCGRQFVVGNDAIMNYLDVLSDNITNAVVLFKI